MLNRTSNPTNTSDIFKLFNKIPWYGAVFIASCFMISGIYIFGTSATKQPLGLKIFYLTGFVLATYLIKVKDIFTAIVQPPLLITLVTLLYIYHQKGNLTWNSAFWATYAAPIIANQFPITAASVFTVITIAAIRKFFHNKLN